MKISRLCDLIQELDAESEGQELPIEMLQAERKILDQVTDFGLFLKNTESAFYPINLAALEASMAFNIEVIENINQMPKLPRYYESLSTSDRSIESFKNILEALERRFGPIPANKLSYMLLKQGSWMSTEAQAGKGIRNHNEKVLKRISWLLSKGADINCSGSRKGAETVLMLQSGIGYAATVRQLLQMGADPNVQLTSGGTALLFCAGKAFPNWDFLHLNYQERLKSMRLLLEAGAKIVTGPKRSDDARYYAGRNTEKEYEGSEEFKTEALQLLQEFSDKETPREISAEYIPEENLEPHMADDLESVAGSGPTRSLTRLLKDRDIGMSAVKANKLLLARGLIVEKERPSTSQAGETRRYIALTETGLAYGINKEDLERGGTSPFYYENTFDDLVDRFLKED